ncbi:ABC transporter G family member 28-like [Amaranthus tricolor]|uniref:ABC transporter G family member 28-like n=1 Tax=Amaranthus tricolor TaxID=29722 RepID=UPI0025831084|nr:ABC transporter G family member 28-like [Amaranthus tricolor]
MKKIRILKCLQYILLLIIIINLSSTCLVNSQEDLAEDDDGQTRSPAALQVVAQMLFNQLANITHVFEPDIKKHLGFCVKDVQADWKSAFNFSDDLGFLTSCMQKIKDVPKRVCNAAEIKIYMLSVIDGSQKSSNYLKPNKNCNLSSWIDGCEPGWACTVPKDNKVDMKNSKDIPDRTQECKPCCAGFFCPKGITCMIPCPLGSYCPEATLNKTTGRCEPYTYQIPPGKPNHTCGGADIWSDVINSNETFCSPGSYCPSTIEELPCTMGHYCRKGSTQQKMCFKLASCDSKTENQNIHAYGILLIATLCTSLLLVYNCSDQVLTTRERRLARSRERAIRSAKETAQARERWKVAKENARNRAIGLQQQLSRTFSKKKSTRQETLKGFGVAKPGTSNDNLDPKSKKKGQTNLSKMMQEIEDDPDNNEGFNVEIGDKHIKKQFKAKELHTRSQIFKYAYGQLEKEKAMQQENKNLTFSGIISMATDAEVRKRPLLEVSFKDLTLTLKGKNKNLLRGITGKLMPGRVSAVMGPSGAGKTTFLSAVTGKATGCNVAGQILINGKNESVHSYKRIIGFVPQDDIVHGNLTVEENLRFSARCRLPDDLPKAEKVLVVERVIEALGLQAIRDSLVGTVEKRGISGGQRKRVNVGLEMVMEPSLLILDEPTSGLDSSSSLLLLRALRREALEGVNICMVIHQPSYALFKMFDDFILLAKGGLTVYHGSTKKVEEYFTGLGITVPERVTPPDHYIDILEGIIKSGSNVTREQLPVRWMLHNGYPVPPDMLHLCDEISNTSPDSSVKSAADKRFDKSFIGDLIQEIKCAVAMRREHLKHNFLRKQDLSNRITPGIPRQYRYFLGRVGKQRLREAKLQAVDYLILLLAGACLGYLATKSDETFGALGYNYTVIAVSLLCKISALRSFTLDRLQYWRESSSGMSSLAYFMAKDTTDLFNILFKPLVYLSVFFFQSNPRSTFMANYIVLVCLVYCVTGVAYGLAILLETGPAQLWCVLLPVVLSLIASQRKEDNELMFEVGKFTYTKWALEAFVIANAEKYDGVWLITRCGSLMQSGYDLDHWSRCLIYLILSGIASRLMAFIFMIVVQKK